MSKKLATESRNPDAGEIDQMSTLNLVRFINDEDAKVAAAVRTQDKSIAAAIDLIVLKMRQGGRLLYIGAGTSGRLGVLDASECPPTFNTDPNLVVGIIAGGKSALVRSAEGAEDIVGLAQEDLKEIEINRNDVLVGIATSGTTPYVIEAVEFARAMGGSTIGICCNAGSELASKVDVPIAPVVGAEVVSGSTRMKAGTATKMVLNMLTTGTMIQLGKTYGDLMVDMRATNNKLLKRSRGIVMNLTGIDELACEKLLQESNGELKTALVMFSKKCSADEARKELERAKGFLRQAIQ